ncbi:MAG TPA: TonB-dependent receptor [Blastocatellia bacterium]|nr:TonB-dependent receptor [Blastocatellia bacterium]
MRPFLTRFVLAALLAAGSLAGAANAQALYGSIVGNVTDPQGAVLHGVSVTITNTGTGLKLEAVTDETGSYVFRNLLPGSYNMTLSHSGFKEMRQSDITVTAGNPKRLDVTLQIGAAQESVTVTADAATLRTEKSDLSTEINSAQVTQLPLNQYRNYQSLLNLVPGATPVQFQNAEIDTPGRSLRTWVNGTQPNSNTTRVDGAVSVNVWLPHHAGYIQPAETIETVNIATNNFDADIGMAGGAAQTVVTKSGTNQFHGSAFEFMNFDELNANGFANNANSFAKAPLSHHTYGGTFGGPILKEKLFFFGSYEKFRDRRGSNVPYVVPTDKMRNGDFTEVAAVFPNTPTNLKNFLLYNPATGDAGGTNRQTFDNFTIPGDRISPLAKAIMNLYPKVNSKIDLNRNGLLDDYAQAREVQVDRANYDTKITWQRTRNHSIWGKVSLLRANVVDNYILGFDQGSLGDTKVYVVGGGHTWTLSPTLLLDGNFGYYRMDQVVTGPDFGKNYGLDLGIKGVNDPNDIRASGLPTFANGYEIGSTPNWMPLNRKELNYSFSSALTKVFPKHELRVGVDIVKLELNHLQAEFGTYGLKGGFGFNGNITGRALTQAEKDLGEKQYVARSWNQFAAFLLGQSSSFAKDVQTEEMTGREWQSAVYVRDRWRVTQNLTVNLGLRLEYYPLMSRATRGIERLDYNSYTVLLGGLGDVPKDVGLDLKTWYAAPRVGVAYRLGEKSVVRAGYGQTINPLPWSRPLRGSFPYDINFNQSSNGFSATTTLAQGIPTVPIPDISSGMVKLPAGVFMRSPNAGAEAFPGSGKGLDRATIKQYNIAFEHRLPWELITEVAYVGTRTDGGYADLNINYGEPGDAENANNRRKFFSVAGSTAINDWAARTRSRYNSLQVALNRPFKNGLLLKGAYTLSRAKDMTTNGEDGWVGLTWNTPLKYADNYDLAVFDRTHIFQMGFLYELPFLKNSNTTSGNLFGGWQLNGIFAKFSGTPFSIGGTNNDLNCAGCGSVLINANGDPKPIGSVGSSTETYYDKSLFSQPKGTGVDGFGNTGRSQFRRPRVWNVDLSLFKQFRVGERFKPEFRIEAANVFNHTNWGAPVTDILANNFLQFAPANAENGANTPGARRIQLGLRVTF